MHFWIDKNQNPYRNHRNSFEFYQNSRRVKFYKVFANNHNNRPTLNNFHRTNHSHHNHNHNAPPEVVVNESENNTHYQWLAIYLKISICVTTILVLIILKLYSDGSLSKLQLITFCILSTIFLLFTILGTFLKVKRSDERVIIDSLSLPDYDLVIKNTMPIENTPPPSYDQLFS
jgi:ABC-type nickel/cobalt efflux system permease component RcnA